MTWRRWQNQLPPADHYAGSGRKQRAGNRRWRPDWRHPQDTLKTSHLESQECWHPHLKETQTLKLFSRIIEIKNKQTNEHKKIKIKKLTNYKNSIAQTVFCCCTTYMLPKDCVYFNLTCYTIASPFGSCLMANVPLGCAGGGGRGGSGARHGGTARGGPRRHGLILKWRTTRW
jgi:hypothetical protein